MDPHNELMDPGHMENAFKKQEDQENNFEMSLACQACFVLCCSHGGHMCWIVRESGINGVAVGGCKTHNCILPQTPRSTSEQ